MICPRLLSELGLLFKRSCCLLLSTHPRYFIVHIILVFESLIQKPIDYNGRWIRPCNGIYKPHTEPRHKGEESFPVYRQSELRSCQNCQTWRHEHTAVTSKGNKPSYKGGRTERKRGRKVRHSRG